MVRLRFLGYLFLTSLICVLLASAPIHAEQKKEITLKDVFSPKVKLDILGDKSIKGQITSYLSRELRSLGDVTIIDEVSGKGIDEWVLEIIVLEVGQ